MSVLIFDVDRSLASIGGDVNVEKMFGIKPITVVNGLQDINKVLNNILVKKEIKENHLLFGENIRTVFELNDEAKKLKLEGIVIDTLSHCFRQDMRILEAQNKSGAMEMKDWGTLERKYNSFISKLTNVPLPIIVNVHINYEKNQDGFHYYLPALKGSTKEFIFEYFDCVFYTKPSADKKVFNWQTSQDASRFGKDRLGVLEGVISQDFRDVINKYKEKGLPNPKILVIGESGSGKTRAILSLNHKLN